MSKTVHTNARRAGDGYVKIREPRPMPRRTRTRGAAMLAELAADTDRVTPGVRRPFIPRKGN